MLSTGKWRIDRRSLVIVVRFFQSEFEPSTNKDYNNSSQCIRYFDERTSINSTDSSEINRNVRSLSIKTIRTNVPYDH